eukprot:gene31031-53268_t
MSKNILITGVSQGLGLAIARAVLDQGWTVSGVSRRLSREYAALQGQHGSRARFHAFDLSRTDDVKAELFDKFLPFETPLHGYVNNAAVAYDDLVSNLEVNRLRAMYEVNVFAPMLITKYAIRHMLFTRAAGAIRAYPIRLAAFGAGAAHALDDFHAPGVGDQHGIDRGAAGRQFVEDRGVEVGVGAHGQGAWDRRGGHDQL